jgi:uncharacterized protein DUF6794
VPEESELVHRFGSAAAIIITFLAGVGVAASQEQDELLHHTKWPTTVEDAVRDFVLHVPTEAKTRVRDVKKEDLILLHFDWGMRIRNRYGLWRGNDKLILSACGQPCHPDDASMKIIEAIWEEFRSRP